MEYIKFYMNTGPQIEVSKEEAERIMKCPQVRVRVNEAGKWTGTIINKNFLICTTSCGKLNNFQPPPQIKENRIRVPGGFQKIDTRERIINFWNNLKSKGCFQGLNSYEEWEKLKYE